MKRIILKIIAVCCLAVAIILPSKTANAAITIDGNLNDTAWQNSRIIGPFTTQKGETPPVATTGKVLTDSTYLYLAFISEEPQIDKLQAVKKPRDGDIWANDCIEIYIAPFADKNTYFHIVVDTAGQVYDALGKNALYTLDVTAKTQKAKNGWTMEVAIPLSNVGLNNNRAALVSLGRERKPVKELSSWHGWFHQPDTWQGLPLSLNAARGVAVNAVSFAENSPQYGDNAANISFTSNADTGVKVLLYALQNGQWVLKHGQTVQTIRGRNIPLTFPLNLSAHNKPEAVRWVINGNEHTLFSLTRQVKLPDKEFVAALQSSYYYASENFAILRVNTFLSPTTIKKATLQITVKDPDGNLRQFKKVSPLDSSINVGLDITGWREGDGAVFVELKDGDKRLAYERVIIPKRSGPLG